MTPCWMSLLRIDASLPTSAFTSALMPPTGDGGAITPDASATPLSRTTAPIPATAETASFERPRRANIKNPFSGVDRLRYPNACGHVSERSDTLLDRWDTEVSADTLEDPFRLSRGCAVRKGRRSRRRRRLAAAGPQRSRPRRRGGVAAVRHDRSRQVGHLRRLGHCCAGRRLGPAGGWARVRARWGV